MADNNEEYLDELLKNAMNQESDINDSNEDINSLLKQFSGDDEYYGNDDFVLDDSDVMLNDGQTETVPKTELPEDIEPDTQKQSKKSKKDKKKKSKEKKKFSIKNFFLDYEEEEKETDENAKLIEKLYQDKDSLDKEIITEPDKKKSKKENKKKEPKTKKVKPAKQKKEKNPHDKIAFDGNVLVPAIIVAAVIIAVVVIGNNIFSYNRNIKSASRDFDNGKYSKAYDEISGLKLKEKDEELYEQIFVMATLTQGLEAYENYKNADDKLNALNALIGAVGRKNSNEDLIKHYGIESEATAVYGKILSILDEFGIDEEKALELYSMRNLIEYRQILTGYGEEF